MAIYQVRCSHPLHSERKTEPGWFDEVLLTHTKPGPKPLVVYCGGCSEADSRVLIEEPKTVREELAELKAALVSRGILL